MRVTFVSKHMPLMDAVKFVKYENVYNAIVINEKSIKLFGINDPK